MQLKINFPLKTRQLYNVIAILFILSLLIITFFGLVSVYLQKPNKLKEQKIVIIDQGISVSNIASKLAKEKVISHPKLFWLTIELSNAKNRLKAGEYAFTAGITPLQIIDMLVSGRTVVHRLTIPEGLTTKQIIDILDAEPALFGEITDNIAEGELLPNTYHYSYGDKRQAIINRMKQKMNETINQLWAKRAGNLPFKTRKEALILASIVEKESGLRDERRRIAAVFINRIKKKMLLQADPTVIYAVTEGKADLGRELTRADLKLNSPYNTYLYKGLPPTPISNPGKAAIAAVLNPLESKELYFVVDGKGGHNFSADLKNHNKHVSSYRNRSKK
jgi:UPF0755 protein